MQKLLTATVLAVAVLGVAACASSSSSSTTTTTPASTPAAAASSSPAATSSGTTLMERTINGTKVLTNSAGFTLYWFALDTSTTSKCNGSCATFWPPVKGPATAGPGVTGTLGVITRSDGTKQATYDGHPLYTFAADKAPGQNRGNDFRGSGGLWYEMTVSGAKPAPAASGTSTSGGYGY